ncbi:MAG TPA: prepilin-type N-terminal cleavage/methylation domain-containing protein [Verrucomicrobiae bacterium]|nr:prepilin-type N-terminal cleavage/methylation domain-containing protein [Verrucomicrobiae bacterium]
MNSTHRNQNGFTLIELLIVTGVIATLLGLLLPALIAAKSRAQRINCQSNLRQINMGIFLYAEDANTLMPVAAPHELGGPQGIVSPDDLWLPARMFGGAIPSEQRPLNTYLRSRKVFCSPADKGEPLWWFDTADYQATASCNDLYGSSYFYASGYNRMGGVVAPMGIAKFVGLDFAFSAFGQNPLPLGASLKTGFYRFPSKKVVVGSIPIYRTMSGVVAISRRAQWYKPDTDRLWANAAFLDGHVEFVNVFAYDAQYGGVQTIPSESNPFY